MQISNRTNSQNTGSLEMLKPYQLIGNSNVENTKELMIIEYEQLDGMSFFELIFCSKSKYFILRKPSH